MHNHSELHCHCSEGLILPIFDECDWTIGLRGILYFFGMVYVFCGMAIGADILMCAIERIIGQDEDKDEKSPKKSSIWNPVVANLTMAVLGTSAPEITLATIELIGQKFEAEGHLGPSVIVGSAAYNLLVVTALCIMSVSTHNPKRIREFVVFVITGIFSLFAYLWLWLILRKFSPNVIEVWEAILTVLFFVALVVSAYIADRRPWKSPTESVGGDMVDSDNELRPFHGPTPSAGRLKSIKALIRRNPMMSIESLSNLIAIQEHQRSCHSRMHYRVAATRIISGRESSHKRAMVPSRSSETTTRANSVELKEIEATRSIIEFSAKEFSFQGNQKFVRLWIRSRGYLGSALPVKIALIPAVARENVHYVGTSVQVTLLPGTQFTPFNVTLIPGSHWTEKDYFLVKISLPRFGQNVIEIGEIARAEVRWFENPPDICRVYFPTDSIEVIESSGMARIPLQRVGRIEEQIEVGFQTENGTAKDGFDFLGGIGEMSFLAGEILKYIEIPILDDKLIESSELFHVRITSASDGVKFDATDMVTILILNDDDLDEKVREVQTLVPEKLKRLSHHSLSWYQQIIHSISVNDGQLTSATAWDILSHLFLFPFKALFSLVPPPSLLGGWLSLLISLFLICCLTALVRDLSAIFGCLIGLQDFVTAITLVTLGTNIPDTFASRMAARQEPDADCSIGHIYGTNSVLVFLGLGIPWSIGSIYWKVKGQEFDVPSGHLGFAVVIYTIATVLCASVLLLRRFCKIFGGAELGGPRVPRFLTSVVLVVTWVIYLVLSSLHAHRHVIF